MTNNDNYLGPIEIRLPSGEYFHTEVYKEGNKLITGTFTNTGLLRDRWEVDLDDHSNSLEEALQSLFEMLEEHANDSKIEKRLPECAY